MELPENDYILLSFVNTRLRDSCPSLEDFCEEYGVTAEYICERLRGTGCEYDGQTNSFR